MCKRFPRHTESASRSSPPKRRYSCGSAVVLGKSATKEVPALRCHDVCSLDAMHNSGQCSTGSPLAHRFDSGSSPASASIVWFAEGSAAERREAPPMDASHSGSFESTRMCRGKLPFKACPFIHVHTSYHVRLPSPLTAIFSVGQCDVDRLGESQPLLWFSAKGSKTW